MSALAGLTGAESQLRSHFGVGLTEVQLGDLVRVLRTEVGGQPGDNAAKTSTRSSGAADGPQTPGRAPTP